MSLHIWHLAQPLAPDKPFRCVCCCVSGYWWQYLYWDDPAIPILFGIHLSFSYRTYPSPNYY